MTLIPDWRAAWRLWSVRLIALGALWSAIPRELLAVIPTDWQHWIGLVIFVGAGIARVMQQAPAEPPAIAAVPPAEGAPR